MGYIVKDQDIIVIDHRTAPAPRNHLRELPGAGPTSEGSRAVRHGQAPC
jgi:hypothetical protein